MDVNQKTFFCSLGTTNLLWVPLLVANGQIKPFYSATSTQSFVNHPQVFTIAPQLLTSGTTVIISCSGWSSCINCQWHYRLLCVPSTQHLRYHSLFVKIFYLLHSWFLLVKKSFSINSMGRSQNKITILYIIDVQLCLHLIVLCGWSLIFQFHGNHIIWSHLGTHRDIED